MLAELKELWKFRELLWSMTSRELAIRYKNSVLGFFWSLLNPLCTVIVMTLVFKYFIGIKIPNYSAYVLAAYLPYMSFQLSLMDAASSVQNNLQLVKKIYFPREILPLSMCLSNFIHFMLAMGVLFLYLLMLWIMNPAVIPFQASSVFLPVLLLINFCLVVGLSLLVAALNVFYEDVKYILSVVLYLLFFLCPVMYFNETVRLKLTQGNGLVGQLGYFAYSANPISALCTAYRKVLLAPMPIPDGAKTIPSLPLNWKLVGIAGVISLFVLWYGYHTFNKLKWKFVERP